MDEQTWNDLLLPAYSAELARETSIFGQQELHRRLYAAPADECPRPLARARPAGGRCRRQQLQTAKDLRRADREISETLFGPRCHRAALAAGAGLVADGLPAVRRRRAGPGLDAAVDRGAGLVAGADGDTSALSRGGAGMGRILDATQQMLRAHSLLPWDDAAQAGKLNRRLSRSLMAGMPGVSEYADWLFLQECAPLLPQPRRGAREHRLPARQL
jgi:hypothetical protein